MKRNHAKMKNDSNTIAYINFEDILSNFVLGRVFTVVFINLKYNFKTSYWHF